MNISIPKMGGYLTCAYGFKLFLQSNILNVDHHHSPWFEEGDRSCTAVKLMLDRLGRREMHTIGQMSSKYTLNSNQFINSFCTEMAQ